MFFLPLGCFSQEDVELPIIKKILFQQVDDWNNGDIEKYMEGYWNSDSLIFIGKSGIKYGWKSTLENYKKSYPDRQSMGRLNFTLLEKKNSGQKIISSLANGGLIKIIKLLLKGTLH